jgi:hypothetical protein
MWRVIRPGGRNGSVMVLAPRNVDVPTVRERVCRSSALNAPLWRGEQTALAWYSTGILMRSLISGLRGGHLLVVAGALALCAIVWINNALFYTSTAAEVLRNEERCFIADVPTSCAEARASGKPVGRKRVVHVRYTSPADGQVHEGVLYPFGAKATEAARLRPGDRWPIFAHDSNPGEIKVR